MNIVSALFLVGSGIVAVLCLLTLLGRNPVQAIAASLVSEETRIAQISGSGSTSDGLHTLFQSVKLNNKDVAMIRRDVRRAIAAYPDKSEDDILTSRWFAFDEAARVPMKGFYNSHGTQDWITKEWYLESAHMRVVRPEFTERADDPTTDAFFAARKAKARATKIDRLKQDGPFASWGGSGGSMSVHLNKETGQVEITRAKEWASKAQKWIMPFVADEWADINESDLEAIKKLPSFSLALEEQIDVNPSGLTITMGPATTTLTSQGRQFDGVLMPGESVQLGATLTHR